MMTYAFSDFHVNYRIYKNCAMMYAFSDSNVRYRIYKTVPIAKKENENEYEANEQPDS